jgi:hypothetical protein
LQKLGLPNSLARAKKYSRVRKVVRIFECDPKFSYFEACHKADGKNAPAAPFVTAKLLAQVFAESRRSRLSERAMKSTILKAVSKFLATTITPSH